MIAPNKLLATISGMFVALTLSARSEAVPVEVTWFTCSAGSGCATPSPRVGGGNDPFTFTATGGQLLVTEAFEVASPVSSAPLNSIFNGGLGAGGENNPEHSVDNTNATGNELIVFMFPEDGYVPISFRLGYVNNDSDTQTWIGGTLGGPDDVLDLFDPLNSYEWGPNGGGVGVNSLVAHGYTQQNFSGNGSTGTYTFDPNNEASGRYLIIAAFTGSDEDDKFKIQSIVAQAPDEVPEPGTLLIVIGASLTALAMRRRRPRPPAV